MDFGRIRPEDNCAIYSSEVVHAEQPGDLDAFYDRVRQWTSRTGVVLGEGTVTVDDNIASNPYKKTIIMRAPVISGTPEDALFLGHVRANNFVDDSPFYK